MATHTIHAIVVTWLLCFGILFLFKIKGIWGGKKTTGLGVKRRAKSRVQSPGEPPALTVNTGGTNYAQHVHGPSQHKPETWDIWVRAC